MKKIIFLFVLAFGISMTAQQKQYKSAETGRYVSKSTATKSPSTTYSTTRSKK
nr:hypothetical protein [uncultured Flavobacterium sp.]